MFKRISATIPTDPYLANPKWKKVTATPTFVFYGFMPEAIKLILKPSLSPVAESG